MMATDYSKCLAKNCQRTASSSMGRGLCLVCYSKAKKMVAAGTTTWTELVSLGLAKPGVEEADDPFTQAFNEAKRNASN